VVVRNLKLVVLAIGACLVLSPPAPARGGTAIDTTGSWDELQGVGLFQPPNNTTWGQTITVPEGDTVLDNFTFYIQGYNRPASFVLRGEVYPWGGSKAIGPNVWESAPRTLSLGGAVFQGSNIVPGGGSYTPVTFETGGVRLDAGREYVLFGSLSKDYEANAIGNAAAWGFNTGGVFPPPGTPPVDEYPGGFFAPQQNGGDESQWTSTDWNLGLAPNDLAFTASFSAALPTSKDQCKNGGWRNFPGFKNQGECVSYVATKGKNPPGGH
jgi:hypothetical protein